MDEKLKARWVKALRSGKYNQGNFKLRQVKSNEVRHCCLGVLCEITPGIEWDDNLGKYVTTTKKMHDLILPDRKYDSEVKDVVPGKALSVGATLLPESLTKHLGLNKRVTYEKSKMDLQNKLANMNDGGGQGFEEIADYIERTNF